MDEKGVEIWWHPHGTALQVRTPGRFAMGVAVEVLELIDKQPGIVVGNTGWKEGFGLEVAAWIPITSENLEAELQTDGNEIVIRKVSGSMGEFEVLCDLVREFLE